MRLHSQSDLFENGFVYLPSQANWLADYIRELISFPGVKYDDQVDSTAQALHYMRGSNDLEIWARLGI
jgi:predicted phage terminase large subunit-like protein